MWPWEPVRRYDGYMEVDIQVRSKVSSGDVLSVKGGDVPIAGFGRISKTFYGENP